LNKRVLSSVTIIVLATLAILPAIPIRAYATPSASLSVSPSVVAGNPGDTFAITVAVDQVTALIAYDVQLNYNGFALHAKSVDFSGPYAGSTCALLPVIESFSDATGSVRAALTTLNGCTVDITAPTPIFVVTFQVLTRQNSALHISTDSECACSSIAQFVSSNIVTVAHTTSDGTFFAEPNIVFIPLGNVTAVPVHPKLHKGDTSTQVEAIVTMGATETLAGFTFVVFDIVTPTGATVTLTSNVAFVQPGTTATVSATYHFGTQTGFYTVFATVWRGSDPTALFPFQTAAGFVFHVSH
jgi:hypothetical protein